MNMMEDGSGSTSWLDYLVGPAAGLAVVLIIYLMVELIR